MTYSIILLVYRKPGTTPQEFRDYTENNHVPLLQSLAGPTFPLVHARRYIQRSPAPTGDASSPAAEYPATALMGSPSDFEYDCIAEHTHASEEAFQAFFARMMGDPETAAKVAEDEEKFLDRSKTKVVVVGEAVDTRK